MGSSDRRWATRYIYAFYRLGKALWDMPLLTRLAVADFLCHSTGSLVVETYLSELAPSVTLTVEEKVSLIRTVYPDFDVNEVFGWSSNLSDPIDILPFNLSFFKQPDLFIRVKEGALSTVTEQLHQQGIPLKQLSEYTLALPNGTKLEALNSISGLYQVQDWSSQKTGAYFGPQKYDYWWDCCAASGGKSLLLHALEPDIQLLVSDIRERSLQNLEERFRQAGIRKYQAKVMDLLQNNDPVLHHYAFDGILLDAPCSGSGTWGRTPEMLYYFDPAKIGNYARLQKAIASNVMTYLKPGKPLIYMTCSVFKAENEDVVQYISENLPVKLEKAALIKGYQDQADSMFVARFIKI